MTTNENTAITRYNDRRDLATVGVIADAYAQQNVFLDYHEQCTPNTQRRQKGDLLVFSLYLLQAQDLDTEDDEYTRNKAHELYAQAEAWQDITHGLVKGFVRWQAMRGYAIGSINVRLATVKVYCRLAADSGAMTPAQYQLIQTVKGYSHKNGRNLDKTRERVRRGLKKQEATIINQVRADRLKKEHPDTQQGRRDALLMCLLLDLGLRCGEVAGLDATSIDLSAGTITFYREKVDIIQTHRLTPDTLSAAMAYLPYVRPGEKLFMGYRGKGLATRSINDRVHILGSQMVQLDTLSPHDCRHYWATQAMLYKTDIKSLQDAGGWASPAMPLRYAKSSSIANEGVKLA